MTTVRLPLAVMESIRGSRRGWTYMRVQSPATSRVVQVSATNPAPHRDAALLYLAGHGGNLGALELADRTETTPAVWHFTAILELPRV